MGDDDFPLVRRISGTLSHGSKAGKRCIDATDSEIVDCIESCPLPQFLGARYGERAEL